MILRAGSNEMPPIVTRKLMIIRSIVGKLVSLVKA